MPFLFFAFPAIGTLTTEISTTFVRHLNSQKQPCPLQSATQVLLWTRDCRTRAHVLAWPDVRVCDAISDCLVGSSAFVIMCNGKQVPSSATAGDFRDAVLRIVQAPLMGGVRTPSFDPLDAAKNILSLVQIRKQLCPCTVSPAAFLLKLRPGATFACKCAYIEVASF